MSVEQKTFLKAVNISCQRQQQTLFSDLNLELTAGDLIFIEGANGAGKSSLLQLLAGLITPTAGDVLWQDQPIHQQREVYANHLHYLGHTNGIKLGLTVLENLCLASELSRSTLIADKLKNALMQLQLDQHQTNLAKQLSAGQKRRLALARLILIPKSLWILDEPLTSLDSATQTLVLQLLKNHLNQGGMCIMSSHQAIQLDGIQMKRLKLGTC